ncbi:UTP--glucose-1-phosphate uridylyltransferase GalU [Colwellia sp. TT2012]|uniref:UTP--glucose-1-phosphate uridylyltransferase GalU n=1 Tax=Colwellia sp. TT2012 TaxID=1720342 RepID=UPI00070E6E32|nr:UTP--glucose-1-phosphate uridylyltransferase GalU [Colwellia sp. TT2012]
MTNKITTAVIPVAGLGTRMLPATKAIPKEMLSVVDKPLIQYVVEEAAAAGIKNIVLVTHSSKNAIENHFDKSFELEAQLEKRVKRSLLAEVRSITPKGTNVISVRQSNALGLGHAILCARPIIGDNPFVVMLPDVLIDKYHSDLKKDNLTQMVQRFEQTNISQVMVEEVPEQEVSNYGVVDINGVQLKASEFATITNMVEKPSLDEAPSNLAITGRYVLSSKIWDLLAFTPPGAGDEIQLTDAMHQLLLLEKMEAYKIVGRSHDCGNKLGYLQANIEYSLLDPVLGEGLRAFLKTVDLSNR